jgi:hypothetical protein
MEKTVKELKIKAAGLQDQIDKNFNEFLDVKELHLEKIEANYQQIHAMSNHASRISKLEDDLIELGL